MLLNLLPADIARMASIKKNFTDKKKELRYTQQHEIEEQKKNGK